MSTETFAGSHLSFAAALPATYDDVGYEALTWTQDDCSSENIPSLSRAFNGVDVNTVCSLTTTTKKGKSKYDPVAFTMLSDWGNTAQALLETAEGSTSAVISVKIEFASGNVVYFTAQVAKFTLSDGGTGDDLNKRSVELWIQSDEIVKVAA
jgi:hypothetical protein